jgi:DNA-binding transcriptional MocR family regulator
VDIVTPAGMFLWVDTGCDTNVLTEKALAEGYLLAPGALFSPSQLPSTRMRINISNMPDLGLLRLLEREIGKAR